MKQEGKVNLWKLNFLGRKTELDTWMDYCEFVKLLSSFIGFGYGNIVFKN